MVRILRGKNRNDGCRWELSVALPSVPAASCRAFCSEFSYMRATRSGRRGFSNMQIDPQGTTGRHGALSRTRLRETACASNCSLVFVDDVGEAARTRYDARTLLVIETNWRCVRPMCCSLLVPCYCAVLFCTTWQKRQKPGYWLPSIWRCGAAQYSHSLYGYSGIVSRILGRRCTTIARFTSFSIQCLHPALSFVLSNLRPSTRLSRLWTNERE